MSQTRIDPRFRPHPILCALAVCLALAGCAGHDNDASTPKAAAATVPDWRNATYNITCDDVVPGGFPARLVDGAAQVPADVSETPDYSYFDVHFETAAVGDLDGDGAPDTVVLLQCSPQPSNGILEEAQVFDSDGHLLGELPSPRTLRPSFSLSPVYDPTGLSIQDGEIVAAMKVYEKNDTHAGGPSGHMTVRWRWDGRNFVEVP
jgi:hypothetical protein